MTVPPQHASGQLLAGAKVDERQVLLDILATDLTAGRDRQIIIGDKDYHGHDFETTLAEGRISLLRPARQGEPERPGTRFFKPLREVIESINDTFKGQLDLERHGGHTPEASQWRTTTTGVRSGSITTTVPSGRGPSGRKVA